MFTHSMMDMNIISNSHMYKFRDAVIEQNIRIECKRCGDRGYKLTHQYEWDKLPTLRIFPDFNDGTMIYEITCHKCNFVNSYKIKDSCVKNKRSSNSSMEIDIQDRQDTIESVFDIVQGILKNPNRKKPEMEIGLQEIRNELWEFISSEKL